MIWSEKASQIKAIILDVDGVLTDGMLSYTGTTVSKSFHARDGHAIKMALRSGYKVGFLSGRSDEATRQRAKELNLTFLYEGAHDKGEVFNNLLQEHNLKAEECLYVGDDVVDIPVILRSGIGVCVHDAVDQVKTYADWQTTSLGGKGAVREIIVRLMSEARVWDKAVERYIN